MSTTAILITQCLQNDFVALLDRYEALPNQLHVGYLEALRLIGEHPNEGPVATTLHWAYLQDDCALKIIHIRDWHSATDARQQIHLEQFGSHCITDTPGSDFVFRDVIADDDRHQIVNASGLNDFIDTNLADLLEPFQGQPIRVGLMGVWTEAKITFLSYDLATRYPEFELAVCSALTASSSRLNHFIALEQLQSILGLRVFSSVASFTEFLGGSSPDIKRQLKNSRLNLDRLHFNGQLSIDQVDQELLLYLFRGSQSVDFDILDGGYSGNIVLRASANDLYGQKQVPHVIKIGPRDLIAQERSAFERVQEVLGNSAPAVVDFAESQKRGAIKYRYAGMLDGGGALQSFQELYMQGTDLAEVFRVLDIVFQDQLGRFYDAASYESLNLLEYYDFDARYAPGVRKRVAALLPNASDLDSEELLLMPQTPIPNVIRFYEHDLLNLKETYSSNRYVSWLHGDLNGANILIDASRNVWMIDFFHTHRGHVLKDLIKLENDLLYIFTKVENDQDLQEALRFSDLMLACHDLGDVPDPNLEHHFQKLQFKRAWKCLCKLRSYYPALIEMDRDPYQLHCGMLRYAMHTLSFDECNMYQRKWALYTGALVSAHIKAHLLHNQKLRVDEVPLKSHAGKLGITILPGRKDRSRDLNHDLQSLQSDGYKHVVCLLTPNEFERYGVADLLHSYSKNGFAVYTFPIPDQGIPPQDADLKQLLQWIDQHLQKGQNVVLHCVGGLGRSGMIAALYLKHFQDLPAKEAIAHVRQYRSLRAIETDRQFRYVLDS